MSTNTLLQALLAQRKALAKRGTELRKAQKNHDLAVTAHCADGGSAPHPARGAALYKAEMELLAAATALKNERQQLNRAINRAKGGYEPRFGAAWKQQAGVQQRAEDYGFLIRYADADKEVHVAPTKDVIRTAPYIGMHRLISHGPSDYTVEEHRCITLDVDGELSVSKWRDLMHGFEPAFIVGRETSPGVFSRPHVIINLAFGVPVAPQSKRDWHWRRTLEEITTVIAARLVAAGIPCDPDIKVVAKNPDFDGWGCFVGDLHKWDLPSLKGALGIFKASEKSALLLDGVNYSEAYTSANVVDIAAARRVLKAADQKPALKLAQQGEGRNTRIFNAVRLATYEHCSSEAQGYEYLLPYCYDLAEQANVGEGLDERELLGIAKSVAKFCRDKVFGRSKQRGAADDLMHGAYSKKARQQRGAAYTHAKRSEERYRQVQEAKAAAGDAATISGVARALGIQRNTVKAYWNATEADLKSLRKAEELRNANVVPLPLFKAEGGGQYGALRETGCNGEVCANSTTPDTKVVYGELADIGLESDDKRVVYLYQHYLVVARQSGDLSPDSVDLPQLYLDAIRLDLAASS